MPDFENTEVVGGETRLKIDSPMELFIRLGPGEVTGNNFGALLDWKHKVCKEVGGPGEACVKVGATNLGTAKFLGVEPVDDPATPGIDESVVGQTQTVPEGVPVAGTNNMERLANDINLLNDAFPGALEHQGFDLLITIEWSCADASAGHAADCMKSRQQVKAVTGLNLALGIGTRDAPGLGDQVVTNTIGGKFLVDANNRPVDVTDQWTTKASTETGKTNLNAFTETPLITWRQELQDPDMSGVIAGGFTEDIIGFFYYNQDPDDSRADLNTMRFPEAVYPSGRCQSLGQTQTIVDPVGIGDTNVVGEIPEAERKNSPCAED